MRVPPITDDLEVLLEELHGKIEVIRAVLVDIEFRIARLQSLLHPHPQEEVPCLVK